MATATSENPKQFLDRAGLSALWEKIYKGFAPRWQSYKPSNEYSTADDRTPADFVHAQASTADGAQVLNIPFVSAGAIKDSEGNKYGKDLVVQISEAVADTSVSANDGKPGLLSSKDKWKIDNLATTAEDAVTLKGIKVNNTALDIDDSKFVNWDLQYDEDNNKLQIVDLNDSNKVMTSVDVDAFLTDALKKGFLASAELVAVDADGATGPFIKLSFTTGGPNDTSVTDVYLDVKDLVDVYTAGTGINITNNLTPSIDGQNRSTEISIKTASTTERGGIKVTKVDSAKDFKANDIKVGRDFQLQLDKNENGFVTVPVTALAVDSSTVADGTVSPVTGNTFQVLKGYNVTSSPDANGNEGWKLSPEYSTLTVGQETAITVSADTATTNGGDITDGSEITFVSGLTPSGTNNHTLTPELTKVKFVETELSLGSQADADNAMTATRTKTLVSDPDRGVGYVSSYAFTTSEVVEVNDHAITIKKTNHSFDVEVTPISDDFIESLEYRVA